jgi:signal transduction histidine kinase
MTDLLFVGAASLVVLQMLTIGGLLALRVRQSRAEEALRTSEATLRSRCERTRRLAGRLINSREAVRAQIARDLNDGVCQELAGLAVAVCEIKSRRGDIQSDHAQAALTTIQRRTLGVVDSVRRLSHDLHPSTLQHIGLAAALQALCIEIEQRHDIQVGFTTSGDFRRINPATALSLFRIVQEALNNAAVHGNARRVTVSIARGDDSVELTVIDDGRGFDVDIGLRAPRGLGLASMEERAHLLGGAIHVFSRPGRGTTIRFRAPANPSVEAQEEIGDSV